MVHYRCFDIKTEDGTPYNYLVVTVPAIDLSTPENRYENLVAISGALESIIGSVETFSYVEEQLV